MSFKKFLIFLIFLFSFNQGVYAELPHYLDFKYILNESTAGKKAQTDLKKKLDNGIKSLNSRKNLFKRRKKIISQKK